MKLQSRKLAMPLLGILFWVLSIHAGKFSDDDALLLPSVPLEGFLDDNDEMVRDKRDTNFDKIRDTIKQKDLNTSVNFASAMVDITKTFERNLLYSDIQVKDGTPSHGMYISFGPEHEAKQKALDGLVARKASNHLMYTLCYSSNLWLETKECAKLVSRFSLKGTSLGHVCEELNAVCTEPSSPYRSINGSCNNAKRKSQGESFTGFARLLYADYSDGTYTQRRSVTKKPLPNPRDVVTSLIRYDDKPSKKFTLALMQWSQFIEHDLSRPATDTTVHTGTTIECCDPEGYALAPRYKHSSCSPINVSNDKKYSEQNIYCLNFVRSMPSVRADCSFGPADQVNQATHYLDGSQIYGSSNNKSAELRSFVDGKLATSIQNGRSFLPLSSDPTKDCQIFSKSSICFNSGDPRVNFQPQLAVMHTLWYREHNRLADALLKIHPDWNDEKLFQEARRIVIAEMQRISYKEWLPAMIGKAQQKNILQGSYSNKIRSTVSNSFATAAMRSIKSLSDGRPKLYDESRTTNESIIMRNYFHKPTLLKQKGLLDSFARGFSTQPSQNMDKYFAEDLINQLYTNGYFGFDVLTYDVQRGRDHGLPSYNEFRSKCGMNKARKFSDFNDLMSSEDVRALSKIYLSPEDVDLIIGALLEKTPYDSIFGPTFSCIVADQMLRTRKGDKYFYDNEDQPKPFTKEQLEQIEKVTLARIICDNGDDIKSMQLKVFELIGASNPLLNCQSEEIPKLDLKPWITV